MKLKKTLVGTLAVILSVCSFAISGCGNEEYVKKDYYEQLSAVGNRYLPSKVDMLIVVDNSASINVALSTVQNQFSGFIGQLKTNYWDYHIATINIKNPANIRRVLVNPKFNTDRLADGTLAAISGVVPADRAVTDENNFSLLEGSVLSSGDDMTYTHIYEKLLNAKSDSYTNFLRPDALLAIVVVTNGAEYSVDPEHSNDINMSALQTHANRIVSIKGTNKFMRFYPIASYSYKNGYGNNYCLVPGGTAWPGESYFQMNSQGLIKGLPKFTSNGETLNFCNQNSLLNVLSDIQHDLDAIKQSYVYTKIVFKEKPIINTLKIYKNGVLLKTRAEDSTNGWDYIGYQTNTPTITHYKNENGSIVSLNPPLGRETGYAIQLRGNSRMVGTDVPSFDYERE